MRINLLTLPLLFALLTGCGNHTLADEQSDEPTGATDNTLIPDGALSLGEEIEMEPPRTASPPPPKPEIEEIYLKDGALSLEEEIDIEPAPTGDRYAHKTENAFVPTDRQAVSTFAIDADGGAYTNVRRYLQQDGWLPPPNAVRTEEMINYFDIDYPFDNPGHPIALNGEVTGCPWNTNHRLIRVGLQGRPVAEEDLPANFVFLVDVSGSMSGRDRLPLLKAGMHRFVDKMGKDDYLSVVTYASRTEVHLSATSGRDKPEIRRVIDRLQASGGTNGGAGIELAYAQAEKFLISGGNNRILLGTDGDFNLGASSHEALLELIEEKRKSGIFLTVLGVGRGNLNDATMEQIANTGNGTYAYIDKVSELEKVFFQENGKFNAVAKDVKVQIKFNPDQVKAYRLIGYENRILANQDFTDDTKDAGEIGAGQNVTALYEIIPTETSPASRGPAITIDFRYKLLDADRSFPLSISVSDAGKDFARASDRTRFTAAVAAFSLLLIDSEYKGSATYADVLAWLEDVELDDKYGYRQELVELVKLADGLNAK